MSRVHHLHILHTNPSQPWIWAIVEQGSVCSCEDFQKFEPNNIAVFCQI